MPPKYRRNDGLKKIEAIQYVIGSAGRIGT